MATKHFLTLQETLRVVDWLRANRSTLDYTSGDAVAKQCGDALGVSLHRQQIYRIRKQAGITWKRPKNPKGVAAMRKARIAKTRPVPDATKLGVLQDGINATAHQATKARESAEAAHREIAILREQIQTMRNAMIGAGFVFRANASPVAEQHQ